MAERQAVPGAVSGPYTSALGRRLRTVAALGVLILTAAGCGGSGGQSVTPGVTATTVTIGSHMPLTGPLSAGFSEIPLASKAYFDYVNSQGGVNGRKIIFDYLDDAGVPANAVAVVHNLVEQQKVFAVFDGWGTETHQAVVDYLNAAKVPDLFPGSGCTCFNDPAKLPYTFGWVTSYRREGKILGSYVKQTFAGKRVAYLYPNNLTGQDEVAGLDTILPAASVVARQSYQFGYTDITPQVQAIISAKPDVIVLIGTPAYVALLRLGQQKLHDTAQVVVNVSGSDPMTLSNLLGPNSALSNGVNASVYLTRVTDTSSSWAALVRMIHDRYLPTLPLDQNIVFGVGTAYTFVEALERAGKNPTRQSLVAALERGGMSPGVGLTPLEYSRTSHAGYAGSQIGVIQGNLLVLQGQPMITDDGNGPITPYTTPLPPAPANGIPTP